MKQGRRLLSS